MINHPKLATAFMKEPKQICIALGGVYSGFGAFAFLIMTMQKLMLSKFNEVDNDPFTMMMTSLHDLWGIYMPLMIVLGLLYISFGLAFNLISTRRYLTNLILSGLCLTWAVSYSLACFEYIKLFTSTISFGGAIFKYIPYAFSFIGLIVVVGFFTVPQYLIGKKIKQSEPN